MNEHDHERGLRLLGLWPGPLDAVSAAPNRAAAAAELANVQALARSAKRLVARRTHPDLAGRRSSVADLSAALSAADWIAGVTLDQARARRAPPRATHRRGPVEVQVTATGVRIAYRGNA